jgi:predicted extracellular nuclease
MKKLLLFTFLSIFGLSEMNAQLFISEVADPADISNAKFVELFNAGDVDIDFSSGSYYIVRQANGGGYGNVQLTGTISAKGTFVVAYNQSSYTSAYGSEANMYDNIVSGNGDDGYFLYIGGDQTTGTLVDAYGVPDEDGTNKPWEYKDGRAVRNADIGSPNTTWTASEWTITRPANAADMTPGQHTYTPSAGDTDPPKWSAGYPFTVARDVNAVVYLKTDEAGMAYAIAVDPGSDAPTSEQVKAGTNYGSVPVLSSGATPILNEEDVFSINLKGLAIGTSYDIWVVAEDDEATPNLQTSPLKMAITTTAARKLTMTLPKDKDTIYVADTLHLKWSSQYIDSLYIKVSLCGVPGSFIITDDDDNPVVFSAFDQSFDLPVPPSAVPGYFNVSLVDAADTSFSSNQADSILLVERRSLEWVSPEDGDSAYVGDTVKLVWTAEYVDSIFLGGYDYSSGEDFIIEDEEGNPLIFDASLGTIDFPIPLDAETDSVMLVIYDASAPLNVSDTIDPLYIVDTLKPEIDMLVPASGVTNAPYMFTAVMEFNETITPVSGNIYLNSADGTIIKTYNIKGSDITIDGSTITIPLGDTLDPGTVYYFTMDAGAVEDLQHNAFEGFDNASTWSFATAAKQPYFSEYVEGSGNNKALEIYNPNDYAIDLSQYAIINGKGDGSWYPPGVLHGSLESGDVYTIVNPKFDFSLLSDSAAVVDTIWGAFVNYFNGDDGRALVQLIAGSWEDDPTFVIIDQIGTATDPGTAWDVAGINNATKDHTLIRRKTVERGNAVMGWEASAGTDATNSEWMVFDKDVVTNLGYPTPDASDNTTITDVVLRDTVGNLLSSSVTIDSAAATVDVIIIYSASHEIDSLVPTITVADGGSVTINGDTIDFTNPVTFTVTAEDGLTTRDWTISVSVAFAPSTQARILSFSIEGQISSVVDDNNRIVKVVMPYGTEVTALTAQFEVSAGATADPPSGSTLDFSDTVKITVTAEDGTNKLVWPVVVRNFEPPVVGIYDIQYTTDASGDSPLINKLIKTSGIVTAVNIYKDSYKGYFLQDSPDAWHGVYVYDPDRDSVKVGDSIVIVGTVTEYYNLTEVKNIMDLQIISHENDLPGPVEVATGDAPAEKWESVLVTFHHATCTDNNLGYGEVMVDDGSGEVRVDDYLYDYSDTTDFVVGNVYNLTGIMNFSYGNFKLNPRSADDISDVTGIRNTFTGENVNVWPNPSNGNFSISVEGMAGETIRFTFMNATGRVVLTREVAGNNYIREEFNLSGAASGLYFIRIDNGKEMTVKRIVIR